MGYVKTYAYLDDDAFPPDDGTEGWTDAEIEEAMAIERWARERAYIEALLDDDRAKFIVLDDGELLAA